MYGSIFVGRSRYLSFLFPFFFLGATKAGLGLDVLSKAQEKD
jgi:hypothetical protein